MHITKIDYLKFDMDFNHLCLRNCANSEFILIVIVFYFLVPPTRFHIDVTTHVNPRKNQCKPWGKNEQEKNKNKIIFLFSPR